MNYQEKLSAAWIAARAPRAPDAPTVVSTFAGGGGSSTGYKMAGFSVKAAVEWMPYPASCYRLNYPETPMLEGDIAKVSVDQVLELTGLQPRELTVFDGSPPCQGFSTAGGRKLEDPRNSLFKEYVRLLQGLQPKAFVMENVSGMVKGKMLWVFEKVLQELKASGYNVVCRVMNAQWFGVPQARQRTIFIGFRDDLGLTPAHPENPTAKIVTVGDACPWLNELSFLAGQRPAGSAWQSFNKNFDLKKEPSNTLTKTASPFYAKATNPRGDGPWNFLPAPPFTGQKKDWVRRMLPGQKGPDVSGVEGFFNSLRLKADRPSATVTKTGRHAGGPLFAAPYQHRGLSIGEAKRLGSFPDEYQFVRSGKDIRDWTHAWGVIGNSVPPFFMRAIALALREQLAV